jgi:uncharacterized protein
MVALLDPDRVTPTAWRNGAGTTRSLASSDDADGAVLWRVSVADLQHESEFSSFPDLNRLFVPLGATRLSVDGSERHCEAGEQVRFAGEAAVSAAARVPTRALNVMTRRGKYRAEVFLRSRGSDRPTRGCPDLTVLLGALEADVHLVPLDEEFHD